MREDWRTVNWLILASCDFVQYCFGCCSAEWRNKSIKLIRNSLVLFLTISVFNFGASLLTWLPDTKGSSYIPQLLFSPPLKYVNWFTTKSSSETKKLSLWKLQGAIWEVTLVTVSMFLNVTLQFLFRTSRYVSRPQLTCGECTFLRYK